MVTTAVQRVALVLVLAFAACVGTTASAQTSWQVDSLIPELVSIRVPTTVISFSLDQVGYPPESFPAVFPATEPEGGMLPVHVFVNADGIWNLQLEVPDLRDDVTGRLISASQFLYRVNEGIWLRADGLPQIIYTGTAATIGWEEIRLEFALELTGREVAGSYRVEAIVSAIRESGF